MNQKQRDFLITQVERNHTREKHKLDDEKPNQPSFNNYIIAAVLDGSVKLKSTDHLKKMVKDAVLNLDKKNNSLFEDSGGWTSRRSGDDDEEIFKIKAKELFEVPDAYRIADDKYQKEKDEWEKKVDELDGIRNTLILKIQIGSDKALETLIEQADNLADLKLMNAQLISTTKQLKA